ncbi:MAG: NADH-quinone oxidoreductase subunit M [Verrucomicrobiota bacterium]
MEPALLLIILFAPLIAALALAMSLPCRPLAVGSGLVQLTLTMVLMFQLPVSPSAVIDGGYSFVTSFPVSTLPSFFTIHFTVGLDGINAPLLLLTSLVGLAAVGVVPQGMRRVREFHVMLLLIIFGATGAFISLDLFLLYIFYGVGLIPAFLMIGIWGSRDHKLAATQMLLYLTLGGLVLLAGLLAFYFSIPLELRSLDLREIQQVLALSAISNQSTIFILLLVGFGTLVSLVPFHSWAPPGYASAPAPVAMLYAGVLNKLGIYGLIRLGSSYLPDGIEQWSVLLQVVLLTHLLYIGWVTIAQRQLDLMIGYASVMQIGYLWLGFLSLSTIGGAGMMLLMIGHGLSTALLFAVTSEIRDRVGTMKFADLGGLARKAPRLSMFFIVGALASIGLPGLANFAGEILIFFGAWGNYPVTTGLCLLGLMISAVFMLRAVQHVCYGEVSEAVEKTGDLAAGSARWPYVLMMSGLVVFGFFPGLIIEMAKPVWSLMIAGATG